MYANFCSTRNRLRGNFARKPQEISYKTILNSLYMLKYANFCPVCNEKGNDINRIAIKLQSKHFDPPYSLCILSF